MRSKGSKVFFPRSEVLTKILSVIRKGRTFVIAVHANPDGDALGSALALSEGLKRLKKRVKVYSPDPVSSNLKFLPGAGRVSLELIPGEVFDATFLVDCAELDRVGEAFGGHPGRGILVVIDHHKKSGRAGDLNWIQPQAPSTGSVVWDLLKRLRVPLTRSMAIKVFTTLVTDTGNFRYSNTDASVLGLAQELVLKGVIPWEISRHIYESYPVERIKLLGEVLSTLEITAGGRCASILLSQETLRETGATMDLADDFINFPRSIKMVEVAVQFRETPKGEWKVSFRSKERVDVAALAARFGGGGHARAAGCTLTGSLGLVRERVFKAVEEAL